MSNYVSPNHKTTVAACSEHPAPPSVAIYTADDADRLFPGWEPTAAWTPATSVARLHWLAHGLRQRFPSVIPLTVVYEPTGAAVGVVPVAGQLYGFSITPKTVREANPRHALLALAANLTAVETADDVAREVSAYCGTSGDADVVALPSGRGQVSGTRAGDSRSVIGCILATYTDGTCDHVQATGRVRPPQPGEVENVINGFLPLLFPGYRGPLPTDPGFEAFVCRRASGLQHRLTRLVRRALAFHKAVHTRTASPRPSTYRTAADRHVVALFEAIPEIRRALDADVRAAYLNDPALAKGDHHLVPLAYPGTYAIAVYRLAHQLQTLGVPYLPRMASEIAHSKTGIDIHPGARIGRGFFIDHGTGVVIGETAVIGNDVKLYQGVTVGALNFPQDDDGNLLRGTKRHPTIHGGTTIYANAAVLGPIEIGHGSQIGANVSLRKTIDPESFVRIPPELRELIISSTSQGKHAAPSGMHSGSTSDPPDDSDPSFEDHTDTAS